MACYTNGFLNRNKTFPPEWATVGLKGSYPVPSYPVPTYPDNHVTLNLYLSLLNIGLNCYFYFINERSKFGVGEVVPVGKSAGCSW